jgi:amino acid transporter
VERDRFAIRRALSLVIVALLGFAYAFWAMVGSGNKTIAWGFMLLMAGLPVYVGIRWWRRRTEAAPTDANGEAPRLRAISGRTASITKAVN